MRLIDADELYIDDTRYLEDTDEFVMFISEEQINNAPTVDAVEVIKNAFKGEMKLMPAEDAPFTNPYKIVLEDLKQVSMFTGKYDAKNGNEHFMFGVLTVIEYIADKAGDEEYSDMFIDNMNRSEYGDKAVVEK